MTTVSSKKPKVASINYFMDTVVKPRYDTERFFISTQQRHAGMTY
ncbi:MAG TPA: palindromic element RPE4 domain-containing protein [Rickettsia endosymbiont of Omalisus fontisbellaquei]|nr:palindromic element RPE4 domain-containing protein [Rickettsia endosymbiont of Omalisus fontisbellaquei]